MQLEHGRSLGKEIKRINQIMLQRGMQTYDQLPIRNTRMFV